MTDVERMLRSLQACVEWRKVEEKRADFFRRYLKLIAEAPDVEYARALARQALEAADRRKPAGRRRFSR